VVAFGGSGQTPPGPRSSSALHTNLADTPVRSSSSGAAGPPRRDTATLGSGPRELRASVTTFAGQVSDLHLALA
jgi:hypothetical protein